MERCTHIQVYKLTAVLAVLMQLLGNIDNEIQYR